ncbi:MAG: hypothetical protein ACRDTD_12315 [Pseudonocardiaceae bacterium]
MPEGSCPESDEDVGKPSNAQRCSLAELTPSRLREWLPGIFAVPTGPTIPEQWRAFCGLAIRAGQAELVTVGTGIPCVACVVAAPNPEAPDGTTELRAGALTTERVAAG